MSDGWRLVIACPDGTTRVADVTVSAHVDGTHLARVRVDHGDGVALCHGSGDDDPEAVTNVASNLACFGYVTRETVPPGGQTAEERVAGVVAERDAMKAALLELVTAEVALETWRPGDAEARDDMVLRLNGAWLSAVDALGMAR